jgi:hypothetical protein
MTEPDGIAVPSDRVDNRAPARVQASDLPGAISVGGVQSQRR